VLQVGQNSDIGTSTFIHADFFHPTCTCSSTVNWCMFAVVAFMRGTYQVASSANMGSPTVGLQSRPELPTDATITVTAAKRQTAVVCTK
jgi:hypothetical protein